MLIDHLVYAVPDLSEVGDLGIELTEGGRHVGRGTRNLLANLGGGAYFEVIGPDRDQPEPGAPRPFGIDELTAPKLVAWAARVEDIDDVVERAKAQGYDPGPVAVTSRRRADGVLLEWRHTPMLAGPLPFLIDWGTTPHPADSLPTGAELVSFRIQGDELGTGLQALGIDVAVESGPPGLTATIRTPKGEVVIR
ncbi:hypothetical protein AOZ06_15365 [Kibdelosporangium phytohabitans]|uniref:Glyoxalase-like domain-containing protein n=1 Tax=Kibdelosporangium phytohabitans TaxID=860235 RepID=A0A0N9HSV5_9PSEU|nr:hypothetical protein AOZ06_15365 [Kibdelosporangium phytohabitans]